ncbi:BURP domain-containing protein 3 [Nymphaea thermarum]|nr:BURP domain-containing protein 3 [Nymphaea thermarum]
MNSDLDREECGVLGFCLPTTFQTAAVILLEHCSRICSTTSDGRSTFLRSLWRSTLFSLSVWLMHMGRRYAEELPDCVEMGSCSNARIIHAHTITSGFNVRSFILNRIIDVYAKFGRLHDVSRLFEKRLRRGVVAHTTLIAAYSKHVQVETARELFDGMLIRDVVSYNAMMLGLVQNGQGYSAIQLFLEMARNEVRPDDFIFTSVLSACDSVTDKNSGMQIHSRLVKAGFRGIAPVAERISSSSKFTSSGICNCSYQVKDRAQGHYPTLEMEALELFANMLEERMKLDEFTFTSSRSAFANCRFLREGLDLLMLPIKLSAQYHRQIVSWYAMIATVEQHGCGEEALKLFEHMLHEGIGPDRITFLTVLSACRHAGLVEEGCKYFKTRGNLELGIQAAEKLLQLRPQHDGTYMLSSNMYAAVGKWGEVAKVRQVMKDRGVEKQPRCSFVDMENQVHVFLVDDTAYPEVKKVYSFLDMLGAAIRKLGSTDPSQSKYASSVPFDRCFWQEYKHGATLDEVIQGGHGLRFLFLEQNLKPGSMTKKLDFEKKIRWPPLLPRKEAEIFPFSTSKLGDILKQFKIDPNSAAASKLRQTLKDCEREPDEGETSFCATSLESMADFAVSQLKTDDIQLLTYSFVNKEEKDPKSRVYTVQHGVVELASRRAVACHIESYPYAVFYCHTTVNTKTYTVPLIAEEDGTRLSAGAVCHIDTTSWNPNHATMLALGIKPGTPVCHFLSHGHFMFVTNSAS